MIVISEDVSIKLRALIDEIKDAVPHELLPSLATLESQLNALTIDDGLLAELIALLSICTSSENHTSSVGFSKKEEKQVEQSYNDLIVALNDIRIQEGIIASNRIRR